MCQAREHPKAAMIAGPMGFCFCSFPPLVPSSFWFKIVV